MQKRHRTLPRRRCRPEPGRARWGQPCPPARPPARAARSCATRRGRGATSVRSRLSAKLDSLAPAPSHGRPRCAAGMAARARSRLWSWLQVLSACTCWGFLNSPARQHRRYQVNGMLGGTVWLVLNMPPGKMVDKSHLDFQPRSGERGELAVLKGGRWERAKAPNRFGQRLEIVNKTAVRITSLEKGDGGLFEASVRLPSAEVQHHLFNLTVYAPVSEPQILLRNISKTPGMCNMTLWCWVPGDGEHNVSWAIGAVGRPRRALGGSSDWHQLSDHDSTLQLLWPANLSDSSVNCLVRNPVDQKNTSFDLLKICPIEALQIKSSPRGVWITLTIWAVVACIVYAASLQRICSEMRRDKRKDRNSPSRNSLCWIRRAESVPTGLLEQRGRLRTSRATLPTHCGPFHRSRTFHVLGSVSTGTLVATAVSRPEMPSVPSWNYAAPPLLQPSSSGASAFPPPPPFGAK